MSHNSRICRPQDRSLSVTTQTQEEQTVSSPANQIVLHRATQADVDAITALVQEAYAKWVPLMGVKPIPMLTDYAEAVLKSRIDLHDVDGRLAALIEMHPTPDALFIANVAVALAHQGRGLGRALMVHAGEVAAALGLGALRLFVNQVMAPNIRLYTGLGYVVDREVPFRGGVVFEMSKRL